MTAIVSLVDNEIGKAGAQCDLPHEVVRLMQENELLQEDNRQLRAAATMYRSTVRMLMNRCGMQYPGQ
jgi:hypothetical protein